MTAQLNAVERLLRTYMKALSDSNRACKDYVRAVRAGAVRPIRRNANIVDGMAAVRAARSALQHYIKSHSH